MEQYHDKKHGNALITNHNILFGFRTKGDIFTVLHFCILIAKYHIYCHNENGINSFQYLIELKNNLRIERYICTSTARIETFDKF